MIAVVICAYFYISPHLSLYQMASTFKILLTADTDIHIQPFLPCLTYWLLLQHCFCFLGSLWVNFVAASHILFFRFYFSLVSLEESK